TLPTLGTGESYLVKVDTHSYTPADLTALKSRLTADGYVWYSQSASSILVLGLSSASISFVETTVAGTSGETYEIRVESYTPPAIPPVHAGDTWTLALGWATAVDVVGTPAN